MNSKIAFAFALIAAPALLLSAAPAMADDVQWSVTVGSPDSGYHRSRPAAVYAPPPQAVYLPPPPVAYGPPPRVVQVQPQPRVVYVRPQPVYTPGVTVVEYGGRPAYGEHRWHRHHHEREWSHNRDRDRGYRY